MSLRFVRRLTTQSRTFGAWSEFTSRPASLKLADETFHKDLFEGISKSGPKSVADPAVRSAYHSPLLIDETFKTAFDILEKDAEEIYSTIAENKDTLTSKELNDLQAQAEENNPEVLHNVTFNLKNVDRSQPVYRKYLQQKWESLDLMVAMQRLEQLHVIPDTMPTLEPTADVRIKFAHNTDPEFADWVEPGTKVPAFSVSKPPTVEITDFAVVDNQPQLYSVLVVNPDVPDHETNSFKTSLNYGLFNVPLTPTDNTITPGKLLSNPQWVFHRYQPLLPEKNVPTHRACLWVFKQEGELKNLDFTTDKFDIRKFAEDNSLTAVGAHVWRQDYDRSVNKVREEYGLPKGTVYHRVRGVAPML